MTDAVISSVLTQFLSILQQQVQQEIRLVVGVDREIENLQNVFKAIQTLVADAERRQVKGDESESIKLWLQRLQDVAHDMDDVLSDWGNALLKMEIEGVENSSTRRKKVFSLLNLPCFCCSRIVCRRDIAIRIKEISSTLNGIATDKERYHFAVISIGDVGRQQFRASTTSFVDESKVHGRNGDRGLLIGEILKTGSEKNKGYQTIALVGPGGIGKTTLAGSAYNSEIVVSFFDVRVWICVSEPPFDDELRVAKAILEQLEGSAPNLFQLESVLGRLSGFVRGKKFLLVMDDVWNEDFRKWESLRNALTCGGDGSKVLITTQKVRAAKVMESVILHLLELSDEDCWRLFSQIAFHERKEREKEELEVVGKEIAKKCKGLPLATKIMANFLRFNPCVEDWKSVLDSDMWGLEATKDVFPALLLSYYDLISPIKNCFLFCANFPLDFEIDGDNLIKLWMAHGCLSSDASMDMEAKGKEYLETLISRSFFQARKREEKNGISVNQLRMHDMVLRLAQFLREHESVVMEATTSDLARLGSYKRKVRHLTLIRSEDCPFPDSIPNTESLHSFWVQSFYDSPRIVYQVDSISPEFFQRLAHLKSLDLSRNRLYDLPSDIDKLQNLRFLNLSYNPLPELPEKVCVLYRLQTLKLVACNQLTSLPKDIGKLKELRHLEINKTDNLNALPGGIAELPSLRTLSKFVLTGNGDSSCTIADLRNLNQLRGSIEILGLGHVADAAEAAKGGLKRKEHLTDVHLDFRPQLLSQDRAEEVAVALELHSNVQYLLIRSYNGARLPAWITSLTKLTKLRVADCPNLASLPALGTQLPLLETLILEKMPSLKMLGNVTSGLAVLPKLKKLKLLGLSNVEEWNIIIDDAMPKLQYLKVSDCKKMIALPGSLLSKPSLRKLYINNCPLLQQRYNKITGEDWMKVCHIAKVKI